MFVPDTGYARSLAPSLSCRAAPYFRGRAYYTFECSRAGPRSVGWGFGQEAWVNHFNSTGVSRRESRRSIPMPNVFPFPAETRPPTVPNAPQPAREGNIATRAGSLCPLSRDTILLWLAGDRIRSLVLRERWRLLPKRLAVSAEATELFYGDRCSRGVLTSTRAPYGTKPTSETRLLSSITIISI